MTRLSVLKPTVATLPAVPLTPILMITPPSIFLLDERVFVSLGILKVAAMLEKRGARVEHIDLSGIENFEQVAKLAAKASGAVHCCITTTTPQLPAAVKIAKRIRAARPDMRIILGGPHVTLSHAAAKLEKKQGRIARGHRAMEKLHGLFDVLVAGDGELAVFHALQPNAPRLIDGDDPALGMFMDNAFYDESPWPARHLIDLDSYKYSIEGNRATNLIGQLGCPYGCNFSLTGDTLISTERGFERLADMRLDSVGEHEGCVHGGHVFVHRFAGRVATRDGWQDGIEVVDEGVRPVLRLRTENGLELGVTREHPMLVVDGEDLAWRNASELRPGDWLVLKDPQRTWPTDGAVLPAPANMPEIPAGGFERRAHHRAPTKMTPDLAWFVGMIIGDGSIPMDGRPSIHVCVTEPVREKLTRVVSECFGVPLSIRPASNTSKMHHGWIHSRLVYAFFTDTLGIKPGDKLHVPHAVLESPRDVLEAFVRGLLDADGYDEGDHEYLTTASPVLAREFANCLLMLGKVPNVQQVDARGYGPSTGKRFTHYRVGFYRNDRIPTSRALYRSKKSGAWHWRTPRQPKTFLGVRRRTLVESGLNHPLNLDGYHYVRVASVTEGLPERVYDLRVPGSHSFLADGLVSHNCGGRNSRALRVIRMRTPDAIVAEIEHLHRAHGFTGFNLFDDELNVFKDMVELMNKIGDLQERLGASFRLRGFIKSELFTDEQAIAMRRAGFRWVLCGFEGAHPEILESINKKATVEDNTRVMEIAARHDLKVKALMSIGHAGEREETVLAVRDWLLTVKPADFDTTIITAYPGSPYYDSAVPHESVPDAWTFTAPKTGARLHSFDVDYTQVADYYKGDPDGQGYSAYVFTDYLSGPELVKLRDGVEREVRAKLNIPFNAGKPAVRYEHSMGMAPLPGFILRGSGKPPA